MKKLSKILLILMCLNLACAPVQPGIQAVAPQNELSPSPPQEAGPGSANQGPAAEPTLAEPPVQAESAVSTEPAASAEPSAPEKVRRRVDLTIERGDMATVTREIFSRHVKRNCVLDPALRGQISLHIEGEYDTEELLDLLTKAYLANGVEIEPRGDVYVVRPVKAATPQPNVKVDVRPMALAKPVPPGTPKALTKKSGDLPDQNATTVTPEAQDQAASSSDDQPDQPEAVGPSRGPAQPQPGRPAGPNGSAAAGPNRPQRNSKLSTIRQKVVLNFDKADIGFVTSQIFAGSLKLNYVLEPSLRGQLSLYIEGNYNGEELLDLVTKTYRANNVDIVRRGEVYIIQPLKLSSTNAALAAPSFLSGDGRQNEPMVIAYRLNFLTTAQALKAVKSFIATERTIVEEPLSNSLVFVEEPERARTIVRLLKALDINILQEVGMEIVTLTTLDPKEAVKSMESVMGKLGVLKQSALANGVAFIPLEHLHGVLVLSQNQDLLQAAIQWLNAMDVKGQGAGEQVHVHFVENGLAEDIANNLNQIYANKSSTKKKVLDQKVVDSASGGAGTAAQTESSSSQGDDLSLLTGQVRIIADEVNNSIIIKANPVDHARIKKTIETLDIMPREVMIEVLIAEVTLTNELEYGVQWFFRKGVTINGREGRGGVSLDVNPITGSLAGTVKGFSAFWSRLNGDIGALVNLLATKTRVNVLSNPNLLAADNKEATFTVGGKVPILTQQSQEVVSGSSPIINSYKYEETGLILKVKPHISSGGLVRVDVDQTLRNVVETASTSTTDATPSFTERSIVTSLVARDGQTVLIGGIIMNNGNDTHEGIPLLKDIPLLSLLFSTKSKDTNKTELIIAITPRIIRHDDDQAVKEFTDRLLELKKTYKDDEAQGKGVKTLLGNPRQ